jgi:hypothetical protein
VRIVASGPPFVGATAMIAVGTIGGASGGTGAW